MNFPQLVRRSAAALAVFGAAASAGAQPVTTIVVPYPAGGPGDFAARTIQPELQKQIGQTIVVDNVGGVGGALGVQKLLQAKPDGQTLLMGDPMALILAPIGIAAVKHKPEDLRLVARVAGTYMVLITRPTLGVNTVNELIALAKQPGKQLSYGSVGPGSLYHLVAEDFSRKAGVSMLHAPYKGGAPLVSDLMGGHIDLAFMPLAGGTPALIKEGKVKALGLTSRTAHPSAPELPLLPTIKGLEGLEFDLWVGLQVPRATPEAVVARLNAAVNAAMKNPEIRKGYESTGNIVLPAATPAELDKLYGQEIARYQAIAKSINVQPQ